MNPRSSLYLEVWHIVCLHSSIDSRILCCALEGLMGGRSGNLRTNSFRNSFVLIWRWKGYPQFLTHISRSYITHGRVVWWDSQLNIFPMMLQCGKSGGQKHTARASIATFAFRELISWTMVIAASRGLFWLSLFRIAFRRRNSIFSQEGAIAGLAALTHFPSLYLSNPPLRD